MRDARSIEIAEAAEARHEGRVERADNEHDAGNGERSARVALLDARFSRFIAELDAIQSDAVAFAWDIDRANDDAELWMRALEDAMSCTRRALGYFKQNAEKVAAS